MNFLCKLLHWIVLRIKVLTWDASVDQSSPPRDWSWIMCLTSGTWGSWLIPGEKLLEKEGWRQTLFPEEERIRTTQGFGKNINDHLHAVNRVISKKQEHTHLACCKPHTEEQNNVWTEADRSLVWIKTLQCGFLRDDSSVRCDWYAWTHSCMCVCVC